MPDATTPPRRRRLRRTWPQRLVLGASTLLVMVCLASAWAVWYANHRLEDLERVVITHSNVTVAVAGAGGGSASATTAPAVDTKPGAAQNYLLVGSDSRKSSCTDPNSPYAGGIGNVSTELSDTIILVRVDPSASEAAILSFPRDLWVTIAGTSRKAKINSAYQPHDPSRLVQTIEQNFDLRVNHYVEVSLCAFKTLVDAVGGVKVPFAFPTKDDKTGLNVPEPGCVSLTGDEALAYVRSRQDYQYRDPARGWLTDGTSDYGRIARQQDFIRRALQKAIDKGARSVSVARDLINVALDNVRVDDQLTPNDLVRLASTLRDFDPSRLRQHSYRVDGRGGLRGNESVIFPDLDAPTTKAILQVFRGQARLSDVIPAAATTDASAPSPTTASSAPSTTTSSSVPSTSSTASTSNTSAATTTTIPTIDVAPNTLGIVPPDDPTCR